MITFDHMSRTECNNMLSSNIQVPGTLAHTSNLDTGLWGTKSSGKTEGLDFSTRFTAALII